MGFFTCIRPSTKESVLNAKADGADALPNPKVAPDVASNPSTPSTTTSGSAKKQLLHSSGGSKEDDGKGSPLKSRGGETPPGGAEAGGTPSTAGPPRQPDNAPISAQTFTFKELERATGGFSHVNFVGEGGFGRVYRGQLESTGQVVAVKQLDRNGLQGNREFLVEVLMLSLLHHPNLVNLIGYCADGDQRLLVYEFMELGALEDHLHDLPEDKEPLEWGVRMKVAAGAARGLEYLHDKASPPVIYRDFKSSNILLAAGFHPKLSDFGLAKLGPTGDKTHVSTRVMGTYGYCAPEYAMTGQLTLKSDVYSFGVVLLELITGRRAIDSSRHPGEHNLVAWARPMFKDRRRFPAMADPRLQGRYPMRGLYQALAVAAMCLQEQATARPMIGDVVTALSYLAAQPYDPNAPPPLHRVPPGERERQGERERRPGGARTPRMLHNAAGSPRHSPRRPRGLEPGGGGGGGGRLQAAEGDALMEEVGGSPRGAAAASLGYRESPPKRAPGRMAPPPQFLGGAGRPAERTWGEQGQRSMAARSR